ncbi:DUF1932 domain-containing protein [Actinoplanes sp. NPDC051346]|uniref:NAD(P)-dependent oxidoreductase n=1 Tax=Actinoplanes sp. NPDC051346 TaxID=3155048 RepID=UPI0034248DCA
MAVLHPGQMGAAIGAQVRRSGAHVFWYPAGRSDATRRRADMAGLTPAADLAELADNVDVLLSICPPAAAENLANRVAETGYQGIYVDANAISPARAQRIATVLETAGARFIDAAIIGPPPTGAATARLYLAGDHADRVASRFSGTAVEAVVLNGPVGAASGLKMAYASFQKASRALAAVAHALAAEHDVVDQLVAEAQRNSRTPLADPDYLPSVAARAWRWAPELHDVADSLADANLPPHLAVAAAEVLQRWVGDKDTDLSLAEVLDHLRDA